MKYSELSKSMDSYLDRLCKSVADRVKAQRKAIRKQNAVDRNNARILADVTDKKTGIYCAYAEIRDDIRYIVEEPGKHVVIRDLDEDLLRIMKDILDNPIHYSVYDKERLELHLMYIELGLEEV